MKINIVLFFLIFLTTINTLVAQEKKETKTIFTQALTNEEVTIKVDMAGYSLNKAGTLSDELSKFPGKITRVDLDKESLILTIKYNEFMLEEDFINVFQKNGVDFHAKPRAEINVNE